MPPTPALEITDIHKSYPTGTKALKGLSLTINQGEFFALLGPNGSGKSTLINIISGPTLKTAGTIKIFGKDIDTAREITQKEIGVVPQEISFDSFFTVNEVLHLQSGYYGIKNNQKHIDEILEKLDLTDKKKANTRALSGGMKRRLLIAKALVHKPKLLILDEPTAGVDIELRHNLWKYIRELNEEGMTILLTTHYLEEAETLCERTAIIHLGELVALENTKTLIKSLGTQKQITLSFPEELKEIPSSLEPFKAKMTSPHELTLTFDTAKMEALFSALQNLNKKITDMDLSSPKLEDVFMKLTYNRNE